jgi:hypothetical protein
LEEECANHVGEIVDAPSVISDSHSRTEEHFQLKRNAEKSIFPRFALEDFAISLSSIGILQPAGGSSLIGPDFQGTTLLTISDPRFASTACSSIGHLVETAIQYKSLKNRCKDQADQIRAFAALSISSMARQRAPSNASTASSVAVPGDQVGICQELIAMSLADVSLTGARKHVRLPGKDHPPWTQRDWEVSASQSFVI